MTDTEEMPILVGVGQVSQRLDDPRKAPEPLAMMVDALEHAARDAGSATLLTKAESIYVVQGLWSYKDPGRVIAERIGAGPVETIGTSFGGNLAQACVSDAAREIQAGRKHIILLTGGENGRTSVMAQRRGIALEYTEAPGTYDRMLGHNAPLAHPAEIARGIQRPSEMYAVFENAIRHARGESIEAHTARITALWADFNRVACGNPHAWIRKPYSAEEIAGVSPENPMISFPYPRLMNSNSRVDMGAGLILCSTAAAREAGIPQEKWIYLHAGTEANDKETVSIRQNLHSSPAIRLAGRRALELAGLSIEQIDHFDLYSCFPSAVQVAAAELGIPNDRTLTVTGGLTFGGGPLNDYVLHSIARMAEVLRADPGSTGLVTSNGGLLTRHAFGIYSSRPPQNGFQFENLQEQVDALPEREAVVDFEGSVIVESYTVMFKDARPHLGHAACLTPGGSRTWGIVTNPEVLQAMTREEHCGRAARLDGKGGLEFEQAG